MCKSLVVGLALSVAVLLCLAGASPALYLELSSPGVAFAEGYPANARAQVTAALKRTDLKFLGGHALNSYTSLRYRSDTRALNDFLHDLAKCPGVTIGVRFAKIEDECSAGPAPLGCDPPFAPAKSFLIRAVPRDPGSESGTRLRPISRSPRAPELANTGESFPSRIHLL